MHEAVRLLEAAHEFTGALPGPEDVPQLDDDATIARLRDGAAEITAAAEMADAGLGKAQEDHSDESGEESD